MSVLYDLAYFLAALLYVPFLICKGKFHAGFFTRLGFLPFERGTERPVWIHAVSVGEAMVARRLAEDLRRRMGGVRFVISTVTPTGNSIARSFATEKDAVIYSPLDFSFAVSRFIRLINPRLFIAVETEIWPNLVTRLWQRGVPVAVVNARISDASFKGYTFFRFFFSMVFARLTLVCAQTETDRRRFIALGVPEERVRVTGNVKFDFLPPASGLDAHGLLGLGREEQLLVCGSTHPGEEEAVLMAYAELRARHVGLRMLIAPRHPERAQEVASLIEKRGFSCRRVSRLKEGQEEPSPHDIFLLDTVGDLFSFYQSAEAVFVGGSLVRRGGHNILEPVSLAKPVVIGPHTFNFRQITGMFVSRKAAIQVRTGKELVDSLDRLLSNRAYAQDIGRRAQELLRENRGAAERTLECMASLP